MHRIYYLLVRLFRVIGFGAKPNTWTSRCCLAPMVLEKVCLLGERDDLWVLVAALVA